MTKNAVTWHVIVWLTLGLACYGQQRSSVDTGTVVLHVVDNYGNPVIPTDLRLLNQFGVEAPLRTFDGLLHDLPYGDYTLRLGAPGFLTWTGALHVREPRTRFTAGLDIGPAEGSGIACRIMGELKGPGVRSRRLLWVRLMPVFGSEPYEADVMERGKFRSDGIPCGKYVLAVIGIGEQNVIYTTTVELTNDAKPLSIRIDK